jgi:hypothetical protein
MLTNRGMAELSFTEVSRLFKIFSAPVFETFAIRYVHGYPLLDAFYFA